MVNRTGDGLCKKIIESIGREKVERLLETLTVSGMNELGQCAE